MKPPAAAVDYVPQVRVVVLMDYAPLACSLGLDPAAMLREAGIDPAKLHNPEARLPAAAVVSLLEESARLSGCVTLGLQLAETRTLASIGPLGLLLRHEGSVRAALHRLIEYQRLLCDVPEWSIEEQHGEAAIRIDIPAELRGRQAMEMAMAITVRITAEAVGGGWHPSVTLFKHGPPPDLSVHRRIFRGDLRFGAEFDGFLSPSESLDLPNAFANADFARHARDYADLLARDLPEASLTQQVRSTIRLLLPLGEASLDRIAAQLGMHSRALQRRLAAEGQPFSGVLERSREELARDYLAHIDLPVTEIAHLVGYSSPTSFTRWFTGRSGVPPSQWRAAQPSGRRSRP